MRPEPQDPDFRTRVKASFSRQAFMATIGASLELVEPGEVHIALPFSTHLSQQHGYLHAGATTAIADSANGYAALTLAPADADVLAVGFKINLIGPGSAGPGFPPAHGVPAGGGPFFFLLCSRALCRVHPAAITPPSPLDH